MLSLPLHSRTWCSAFISSFTISARPWEWARCVLFFFLSAFVDACQPLSALIPPPATSRPSHFADSVGFERLTNLHSESQWKCLYKRLLEHFCISATSHLMGNAGVILMEWCAGRERALITTAVNPWLRPPRTSHHISIKLIRWPHQWRGKKINGRTRYLTRARGSPNTPKRRVRHLKGFHMNDCSRDYPQGRPLNHTVM